MRLRRIATVQPDSRWGEVCIYPKPTNHYLYEFVSDWAQQLQLIPPSGVSFLSGGPGTGKTFHMLLFGLRQEAELGDSQATSGKSKYAFYGEMAEVEINDLRNQWLEARGDKCLWLIDDVRPTDRESFAEVARFFIEDEMAQSGHRIIGAGWTAPTRLPKECQILKITVNRELVRHAFTAKTLPLSEVQSQALAGSQAGMRVALWYATVRADAGLTGDYDVSEIEELWAEMEVNRRPDLTSDAKAMLTALSALQIFDAGLPYAFDPSWLPSLRLLEANGLVLLSKDFWHVGDDEQARAWLRHELKREMTPISFRSVAKLLSPLFEGLSSTTGAFVLGLLGAMDALRRDDFDAFFRISGEEHSEEGDLIFLLFSDRGLLTAFGNNLLRVPPKIAAEILFLIRKQCRNLNEIAGELLAQHRTTLIREIKTGNTESLFCALRIAHVAEDLWFKRQLGGFFAAPKLLRKFEEFDVDAKIRLIRLARITLTYPQFLGIAETLSPLIADALAPLPASNFWSKTQRLELETLANVLAQLPKSKIGEVSMSKPREALHAFSHLRKIDKKGTIRGLFKSGLQIADVQGVSKWTNDYFLLEWLKLISRLGEHRIADHPLVWEKAKDALQSSSGTIITSLSNLSHQRFAATKLHEVVRNELEHSLREKRPPINERLFGLAEMDRNAGAELAVLIFETTEPNYGDPLNLFWLMMNGLVALSDGQTEPLVAFARRVCANWDAVLAVPEAEGRKLSLAGLCGFITRDAVPPFQLPIWPPNFIPESPPATACQFYALSKAVPTAETNQWLAWIAEHIASEEPSGLHESVKKLKRYTSPWISILSRIVEDGLEHLRGKKQFVELVNQLKRSNVFLTDWIPSKDGH